MKRTGWNDREASWTERNAPLPDDCEKNHEHTDACWRRECHKDHFVTPLGLPYAMTRMILCPICGNKRCPRATNHELACTGSNEPGQPGSVY